ncbi:MAG: hypothetical protein MJD61_11110 [Proteobacteria bacterium]|nr:hypothetical protein [Pseudomonadota bacterium]
MTTRMRETETDGNRETDCAERERTMHEIADEVMRCVQQQDLQEIAARFETAEVILGGKVYRQHEEASPSYHGLSGSMQVKRWTYREVGVHNGPTIVPLDLTAGLLDNVLTLCALAQSERLPRAFQVLRRDYYVADVRLAA